MASTLQPSTTVTFEVEKQMRSTDQRMADRDSEKMLEASPAIDVRSQQAHNSLSLWRSQHWSIWRARYERLGDWRWLYSRFLHTIDRWAALVPTISISQYRGEKTEYGGDVMRKSKGREGVGRTLRGKRARRRRRINVRFGLGDGEGRVVGGVWRRFGVRFVNPKLLPRNNLVWISFFFSDYIEYLLQCSWHLYVDDLVNISYYFAGQCEMDNFVI